jgi:hypothetical protein
MIFSISNNHEKIDKVNSESFVGLNIWERQHIEEWISQSPEMLGEDLLVVSTEFDRFEGAKDRLDVLAIDRKGNLVVVEVKRDSFAGYADLQAIRYAAMVSTMTIEKLLPYYIEYQKKKRKEIDVTEESSRNKIFEFVVDDTFKELTSRPRIILCSENFSSQVTTTVLWLNKFGVNIACVKITPYQVEKKVIIVPNIIIPLKEASQYLIDIQEKEEEMQEREANRPRTMRILIENGLLKEGDKIFLKNGLPSYVRYDPSNSVYHATITGKLGQSNAVRWDKDNKEYAISSLTWSIFKDLHPEKKDPGGINGNWHWVDKHGKPLWMIAEDFIYKAKAKE